ncbi:hypothetical protein LINGRAHAP2_LOCUS9235 [Linum grandiflorum]
MSVFDLIPFSVWCGIRGLKWLNGITFYYYIIKYFFQQASCYVLVRDCLLRRIYNESTMLLSSFDS